MERPTDKNRSLSILILRSMPYTQDDVCDMLHCTKSLVVDVEKWFENISYQEAFSLCHDQAIKNSAYLDIGKAKNMDPAVTLSAIQVTKDFIFRHYGKRHRDKTEQPSLHPRFQEHYARIFDAADRLRGNIKLVKEHQGFFTGNITFGNIYASNILDERHTTKLINVDRLDAEYLLCHLKAMYPEFEGIEDWEKYNTRQAIRSISGDILKKLKLVSQGTPLRGTCEKCTSLLDNTR